MALEFNYGVTFPCKWHPLFLLGLSESLMISLSQWQLRWWGLASPL